MDYPIFFDYIDCGGCGGHIQALGEVTMKKKRKDKNKIKEVWALVIIPLI